MAPILMQKIFPEYCVSPVFLIVSMAIRIRCASSRHQDGATAELKSSQRSRRLSRSQQDQSQDQMMAPRHTAIRDAMMARISAFVTHCSASMPLSATSGLRSAWRSRRTMATPADRCGMNGRSRRRTNTTSAIRTGPGGHSRAAASASARYSTMPSMAAGRMVLRSSMKNGAGSRPPER